MAYYSIGKRGLQGSLKTADPAEPIPSSRRKPSLPKKMISPWASRSFRRGMPVSCLWSAPGLNAARPRCLCSTSPQRASVAAPASANYRGSPAFSPQRFTLLLVTAFSSSQRTAQRSSASPARVAHRSLCCQGHVGRGSASCRAAGPRGCVE